MILHKSILVIALLSSSVSYCFSQSLSTISKKMYCKMYQQTGNTIFVKLSFKARNKFIRSSKAALFKNQSDTIYIVEGYDLVSSGIVATIWNKKTRISYKYYLGKFIITDELLLPDSWINLLTRFDKVEIKKHEEKIMDGITYMATKIAFREKEVILDDISFDILDL